MRHIVIGLAGYKGSGKNTAASIIETFVGTEQVHQYAFAHSVRVTCLRTFGDGGKGDIWWDDHQKDIPQAFLFGYSPRHWMKQVAQAIRGEDPDFWARMVVRRINHRTTREEYHTVGYLNFDRPELEDVELHLITDLRFENEWQHLQLVQNAAIHMVLVDRGGTPDGHPSEDLSWIDPSQAITLHNNGSLATLETAVKSLVCTLCKPST